MKRVDTKALSTRSVVALAILVASQAALADTAADLAQEKARLQLENLDLQNRYDQLKIISDTQKLSSDLSRAGTVSNVSFPPLLATQKASWAAAADAAACLCNSEPFRRYRHDAGSQTQWVSTIESPLDAADKAALLDSYVTSLIDSVKKSISTLTPKKPRETADGDLHPFAFPLAALGAIATAQAVISFSVQIAKMFRSDYGISTTPAVVPKEAILQSECNFEILSIDTLRDNKVRLAQIKRVKAAVSELRAKLDDLSAALAPYSDNKNPPSYVVASKQVLQDGSAAYAAISKPDALIAMANGLAIRDIFSPDLDYSSQSPTANQKSENIENALASASRPNNVLITASLSAETVNLQKEHWWSTPMTFATGRMDLQIWNSAGKVELYGTATKSTETQKLRPEELSRDTDGVLIFDQRRSGQHNNSSCTVTVR
ncbi:hypothetical protein [Cupriavidus agavae]|uniref:Uncharacterized protein n=1 Tax=Cupriavidus agavae TaxID=1001822 RepID=A0A4Q7RYZ8_9BURK|nr:hypothetical protein [Cupriavidus agavae]RZT39083.1 hypothetical protein EV147_2277 [Cupriavidus agavae]